MTLDRIEDILDDLRQGKMVIIMDDEDRENEGDLLMAAERVTPEAINFMARYGRGLICLTLTQERCQRLGLRLMCSENSAAYSTNFTVSIEAAEGVTTGISARDRARTVQAAVAPDARASDLRQPGHIFPLMAQPGGVLTRAGHTEAGCDLARLAGLASAAVIVEILNEDGTMARRPDLEQFAAQHGLRIGTIADLIRYRMENEKTVQRVAECPLATEYGPFQAVAYQDASEQHLHFALIKGNIDSREPVLVRVHIHNTFLDLFGAHLEEGGLPLRAALERVASAEEAGIVVVLNNAENTADVARRMHFYQSSHSDAPRPPDAAPLRTYGLGAQILADLGVQKMRVLGTPKKLSGLAGFNLEVIEYVS